MSVVLVSRRQGRHRSGSGPPVRDTDPPAGTSLVRPATGWRVKNYRVLLLLNLAG